MGNVWNWIVSVATDAWEAIVKWFASSGPMLLKALLILVIGLWIGGIVRRAVKGALKKAKVDTGISGFICSCIKTVIYIVVIVSAIASLGVNITSIITALGAAGITIGLAMQDTLANFASGVLILFNKPFVTGDYIEVEGHSGTVESIELMYTTLLTPDNKHLVFPNSKMTANKVINYTAEPDRRLDMKFPTSYKSDVQKVKDIITKVGLASEYTDNEHGAVVGIAEFADSAIVFELRVWIKADSYWDAFYDMQEKMKAAFDENEIEIPVNQMDVNLLSK
ncbi:MAG: mechanosensitive ion channel family protein [Clostridia bacterium]|nr:mechanosensitive ion channel family protein [Clostridia bacterium]